MLVVGGDLGTGGAVLLSAEAALRCGAGLVSVATRPEHLPASLARLPEVMCLGYSRPTSWSACWSAPRYWWWGPGGQAAWGRSLLSAVANAERPQVWDADALNLLAGTPLALPSGSILTPHPGEGAAAGHFHRSGTGRPALRASWRGATTVCLLKGAGTLVAHPSGQLMLCERGHPAMAGAGLGDVLTGVLAALLAQGLDAWSAGCLGTWLHACAGERLGLKRAWRPAIWRRSFERCWRSILRVA